MNISKLSFDKSYMNIDEKADWQLSIVISWLMISLFVINSASVLEPIINISSTFISNISKGILLALIIYNLRNIIRRVTITLIFSVLFGSLFISINYLFAYDNEAFITTLDSYLLNVFPVFVVIMCIRNSGILLHSLEIISGYLIIASVFILFFARGIDSTYNMGFANSLTLPVIVLFYNYYSSKRVYKMLLASMGVIVIVALGSRGALLGVGVYAIILLCRGFVSKENRIRSTLLITIIIIGLVFFNNILKLLFLIMEKLNIYSRTLYLLVNEHNHDSGRNEIYDSIIREVTSHPLQLRGIAGEYAITNGAYAHNFVLELLCDFGVLFGGVLILLVIFQIVKTILGSIFEIDPDLNMIFMSTSVPLLLVSGSIWTATYFWLWLALTLKSNRSSFSKGVNEYE